MCLAKWPHHEKRARRRGRVQCDSRKRQSEYSRPGWTITETTPTQRRAKSLSSKRSRDCLVVRCRTGLRIRGEGKKIRFQRDRRRQVSDLAEPFKFPTERLGNLWDLSNDGKILRQKTNRLRSRPLSTPWKTSTFQFRSSPSQLRCPKNSMTVPVRVGIRGSKSGPQQAGKVDRLLLCPVDRSEPLGLTARRAR